MIQLASSPERLYLLRHARSGWATPGARDFDRTLDEAGLIEADQVAAEAAARGYRPTRVLSSSAVRCRQTAEAMKRAIDGATEFRFVDELYNTPADSYIDLLERSGDVASVMLVGHNPAIEELFTTLVGMDVVNRTIPEGYPTSGLAVLDQDGNGEGWVLRDFLVG
ncbi:MULTISPECIES: SixA phosphatase family protein [Alphaproteobacteria]|nr:MULTISPECIES: histidine phosphatase family protein [Alphaproteobacteria]